MTITDPFASAPEEAQNDSDRINSGLGTVFVDVKPNLVGFDELGGSEQVRITFKGGVGYDSPWITTDFPSIDAAHEKLSDLDRQKKLVEVFGIVSKAKDAFIKATGGTTLAQAGAVQSVSSPPPGSQGAPAWAPPAPGPGWVYRTKVAASTGKPWHAWMPPQGSGDDVKPLFFNAPR